MLGKSERDLLKIRSEMDWKPTPIEPSEIRRRTFPNQNILMRLRNRELNIPRPGAESIESRQFYTSVFPNHTVVSIEKPSCFLRKFSPDGRMMVAFSSQQAAVEIFEFRGSDAAGQLLVHKSNVGKRPPPRVIEREDTCSMVTDENTVDVEAEGELGYVRRNIFDYLFRKLHTVTLAHGNEQLNRECSLFTPDGRYLIVAASSILHEEQFPHWTEVRRNNESIPPTSSMLPEDYWIYSVDMVNGQVIDTKQFKCDRIYLAHNQGICLYDRTLAVMSVQHQTIHLFRVDEDGHFIELQSIGRHLYDDDEMSMNVVLDWTYRRAKPTNPRVQPSSDPMLNGLKQRILAFLYRCAVESDMRYNLRKFAMYFDFYRNLRMWRMQLIDETHLLIRYASEDVVTMRVDATSQSSFFVFYDIRETRVLAVYENIDPDLLALYEQCFDDFRGCPSDRFVSTLSNSQEARRSHEQFKNTIQNAKYGGPNEAIRRVLLQLPISAQSFNPSPYLDMELFSYDDKWVSAYERPRPCSDYPLRFHGRKCHTMKFQMHCGPSCGVASVCSIQRSLVAFIFHPYEPFAISIHRNNRDYVVNFHLRHIV